MIDVAQMAVGAAIQGAVGLVFYFAVRRNMDRVDKLEGELQSLKDHRISSIESQVAAVRKDNKTIEEEVVWVKTHFVHVKTCQDAHKSLKEAIDRFLAATMDLARHDERLDVLTKSLESFQVQLLSMKQDFDRFYGRKGGL